MYEAFGVAALIFLILVFLTTAYVFRSFFIAGNGQAFAFSKGEDIEEIITASAFRLNPRYYVTSRQSVFG